MLTLIFQNYKKISSSSALRTVALQATLILIYAASSQAIIPLPFNAVPLSLQPLPVYVCSYIFGWHAVSAYAAYVGLGALGLPIFSAFRGGILHLAGFTGGYLWGFLLGASVIAALRSLKHPLALMVMYLVATCIHFACGMGQLSMFVSPDQVVLFGLLPFLVGDFIIKPTVFVLTKGLKRLF